MNPPSDEFAQGNEYIAIVKYDEITFEAKAHDDTDIFEYDNMWYVVIGNTYENPELLKVDKQV